MFLAKTQIMRRIIYSRNNKCCYWNLKSLYQFTHLCLPFSYWILVLFCVTLFLAFPSPQRRLFQVKKFAFCLCLSLLAYIASITKLFRLSWKRWMNDWDHSRQFYFWPCHFIATFVVPSPNNYSWIASGIMCLLLCIHQPSDTANCVLH